MHEPEQGHTTRVEDPRDIIYIGGPTKLWKYNRWTREWTLISEVTR